MKLNWNLVFPVAAFTAAFVVSFMWNYEFTKNVLFVWGVVSVYLFIFGRCRRRVKKRGVPSYIG